MLTRLKCWQLLIVVVAETENNYAKQSHSFQY